MGVGRGGWVLTNVTKHGSHFVKDEIDEGHREYLVGGGPIRTMGGWSQVLTLRKSKEKVLCDERILELG